MLIAFFITLAFLWPSSADPAIVAAPTGAQNMCIWFRGNSTTMANEAAGGGWGSSLICNPPGGSVVDGHSYGFQALRFQAVCDTAYNAKNLEELTIMTVFKIGGGTVGGFVTVFDVSTFDMLVKIIGDGTFSIKFEQRTKVPLVFSTNWNEVHSMTTPPLNVSTWYSLRVKVSISGTRGPPGGQGGIVALAYKIQGLAAVAPITWDLKYVFGDSLLENRNLLGQDPSPIKLGHASVDLFLVEWLIM